jgi:hypothetical protein
MSSTDIFPHEAANAACHTDDAVRPRLRALPGGNRDTLTETPVRQALREAIAQRLAASDPQLSALQLRRWTQWELDRINDGVDLSERDLELLEKAAARSIRALMTSLPTAVLPLEAA